MIVYDIQYVLRPKNVVNLLVFIAIYNKNKSTWMLGKYGIYFSC